VTSAASARSGRALLRALSVLALGCATPVDPQELPEAPIAVLYWSVEDAQARMEEARVDEPRRLGIARPEDMASLLGIGADDPIDVARRYPGRLGLVDPRDGSVAPIEAAPPGAVPLAWSADRQRLLFSTDRLGGVQHVYQYDRRSGQVRRVTHGPKSHLRADFGPQGRIVHTSWGGGQGWEDLRLAISGGGEPTRELARGVPIEDVRWSPRGDMLVVVVVETRRRRAQARRTLFAIPLDGAADHGAESRSEPLAGRRPLGRGRDPVFGADGDWIVYSAAVGGGWRLWRMRADGSARRALSSGSIRDELQPALSPDGRLVAFVAEENGLRRLFVRRLDGSGERMLVRDAVVTEPVW